MYVGCSSGQVADSVGEGSIPVVVMYPTSTLSTAVPLSPYSIDARCAARRRPSSACGHRPRQRWFAPALPRHLRLVVRALARDPRFDVGLRADVVAVVGHSMDGYSALAVAGGRSWSEDFKRVDVTADPRVKALVLLAPATVWYAAADAPCRIPAGDRPGRVRPRCISCGIAARDRRFPRCPVQGRVRLAGLARREAQRPTGRSSRRPRDVRSARHSPGERRTARP